MVQNNKTDTRDTAASVRNIVILVMLIVVSVLTATIIVSKLAGL